MAVGGGKVRVPNVTPHPPATWLYSQGRHLTSPHLTHFITHFTFPYISPLSPHLITSLTYGREWPHLTLYRITPYSFLTDIYVPYFLDNILSHFLTSTDLAPFYTLTSLLTKIRLASHHTSSGTKNFSSVFKSNTWTLVALLKFFLSFLVFTTLTRHPSSC